MECIVVCPRRGVSRSGSSRVDSWGLAARTDPPDHSICKRCVERDYWKRSLTPQSHGCAACKD
eukprot:2369666-Pyramimonas_sp.AAC.1